ncbi:MAG: OmpA family protein, partial [Bacteroidota bacterium]
SYMRWPILASLLIFSFLTHTNLYSQKSAQEAQEIFLTNPSFEDFPQHSKPPRGWHDCGFPYESPPDVQPSGQFSVVKPAQNGETYLGMVVRDNDTWEMVSQRLSTPLMKGKCYSFSIYVARSEVYVSQSRTKGGQANYVTPAKLRIYGGFDYCDKQYLLAETALVINYRWIRYDLKFEPIDDYTFIMLEAFYKTPTLFPYNGNILLDNASSIKPIPCDEELVLEEEIIEEPETTPIATPTPPATPKTDPTPAPPAVKTDPFQEEQKVEEQPTPPTPDPVESEPNEPITFNKDIKSEDLKEGAKFRLDNIYFKADSAVIQQNSRQSLDELFEFLDDNKNIVIEIGGHTNGIPPDWYCDRLSTERAKAVVDYLVNKGVSKGRLTFKGYGKRFLIASDDTLEGKRKNQRVEVKILKIGG